MTKVINNIKTKQNETHAVSRVLKITIITGYAIPNAQPLKRTHK